MDNTRKYKVLLVSAEVVPFAKTGGLADVAGSLPQALVSLGHDVRIAMPRYKKISETMRYVTDFPVQFDWHKETCIIRESSIEFNSGAAKKKVPVYFVDNYHYFDRDYLYCYYDEAERFAFFCRAVLDMLPRINFQPDIIHCNDWHTGPICMMLKEQYRDAAYFRDIATVYTIHNLQYQGSYPPDTLKLFDVGEEIYTPEKVEFYGTFSYMKAGLVYADVINTVSETYAGEIQTAEYGEKFEGLLRARSGDLHGILNGINYDEFDPNTDPKIYANYSVEDMTNKVRNKTALQNELGLPVREDVPIIGLVSRLTNQKGLDLIKEKLGEIMKNDIQFVILGSGDEYYEDFFREAKQKYPGKVGVYIGFNADLAPKIYAGSDMFIMPSKFEPCGLGQIIAFRYGTIPVVRATGGLKDTVKEFNPVSGEGNGFTFKEYQGTALLKALNRAIKLYREQPDAWRILMRNAMQEDFSWRKSAEKYVEIYGKAAEKISGGR